MRTEILCILYVFGRKDSGWVRRRIFSLNSRMQRHSRTHALESRVESITENTLAFVKVIGSRELLTHIPNRLFFS